ncbi:cation diffusion facilitator family transporter [Enhydrobacter aerosaccus]|uniref:Cation diffusion facilitator family transporter n=1 Tax=Enhydrobacter aerosaccus TaxID=225324 RepID=A0A1T4SW25_9HYPH|nr:cation diffusion facilitator family transporter [Enhydrobacter aerosaccus]SKA32470.1 cation diffusion facilitator family transporter [Enhydrobacter aerosaccus]
MLEAAAEQRILKISIAMTVALALFGLAFGLVSGSLSIVFDGVFSVIDAAMSGLALFVSRLVTRETENRRFQYGFWHIEPMVLAFNGGTLMLLCFYAFVNAAGSFLAGGRQLAFDWAIAYSVVVCIGCFGMYFYQRRANQQIGSDFVQLDAQSWLMSALITSALLVAFLLALVAEGSRFDPWLPYVDPVVLAVLSLCLVFVPIRTVRQALTEILLITPPDLDEHVRSVMQRIVAKHGFRSFTSYVAKVGRAQFIEIHIAVAPDWSFTSIGVADAIRREISEAIGEEGPERWLTIDFTADPEWL